MALLHVIVAQQVSTHAAKAISDRLDAAMGAPTPEAFLALTDADLRAVGFSRQKVVYGRDLAARFWMAACRSRSCAGSRTRM